MDKREAIEVKLSDPEQTERLGESVGQNLRGGEAIELTSDLGGGKTTLTRGIVRGSGSTDHVSSPSFTLRNDYQAKGLLIAHFDFYRINDPGILKDLLEEAISDPDTVVVIEWAQIVNDVLPTDHVKIELKSSGKSTRIARISYPEQFRYLFSGEI